MSLMEAVSVNTENIQSSLMQFSVAEDFSTNFEDIRMSITDVTLKNGGVELLTSKMEAHAESPQTTNPEKSSENMSLCKSMELEPNRICLLETRKKRRVSPVSFMEGMKPLVLGLLLLPKITYQAVK